MAETERWPAVHRSVFAKLVVIMMAMALAIMGLVAVFFFMIVNPTVTSAVERLLGDYAQRVAADAPGRAEARRLADRLDLQIRYEGPGGAWTTDERLPSIAEVLQSRPLGRVGTRSRYVVEAPDGGRYLFSWEFGRRTRIAHDRLLAHLLLLMLLVFLAAHFVLRRALRPLHALRDGVARLGDGDLDVVLPNRTRDEFGVLTAAFNRMVGRVKDMVRARDQLLLDVSHELRSPLTRLKVALALLPDSARKAQAEADAAEMEAMIAGLLEFERRRDGRAPKAARADLVALVREAARLHAEGPPGVRVRASPEEIPVDVDVEGVRTVVRNLLDNAVKYSLPDSRPVEVQVAREGGSVVLRVSDDGTGIPPADLENVFEPFFRVDRSRSRRTGGYGLGLGICRRIVGAHGGTITASNNPGRGACLTVTLPAPAGPEA